MQEVIFSRQLQKIIHKTDFSRLGTKIGIKLHFGERGCNTYLKPEIAKAVYDKVISLGKNATLIETNVLYRGSRTTRPDHLKTAEDHGFTFAPIDILDGEKGEENVKVKIEDATIKEATLGKGLERYDSLVVITHFKGHMANGYGGIFKNIGMGLAARSGKLHMHSNQGPYINRDRCTGCGICIKSCNFDAISLVDGKAEIKSDKCAGCAMCIAVCPASAPQVPWGSAANEELQKRIIDYSKAVLSMIPKERCIFINVLKSITKDCDCMGFNQTPIMEDVGFIAGYDPVAVEKASLDLVNKNSSGRFDQINSINKSAPIRYAESIGLGTEEYEIIHA